MDDAESLIEFVGNVLTAVLMDLKAHGADNARLEGLVNRIEASNEDIMNDLIRTTANLYILMALAKAQTSP